MNSLERLSGSRSGSVASVIALAAVPFCLVAGMAVDYATWTFNKQTLQVAAEESALAGARVLAGADATPAEARLAALALIPGGTSGLVPQVSVDPYTRTVMVTIDAKGGRSLSNLALTSESAISVMGIARVQKSAEPSDPPLCALALDPRAERALLSATGARVSARNCWIQVNSTAQRAVSFTGMSVLTSSANCFVGGVDHGSSLILPAPTLGCRPMVDPFAAYVSPKVRECDHKNFKVSGGSRTLQPGVYCGGITLENVRKVTLKPGLYVIKNGLFTVTGGGNLEGDGITIFLTGNKPGLNWSDAGSYRLIAPSENQPGIPGFVVFLDRNAAASGRSVISASGRMWLEGIVYLPTQDLEVASAGPAEGAPFTVHIARTLKYSGPGQILLHTDASRTSVFVPEELRSVHSGAREVVLVR